MQKTAVAGRLNPATTCPPPCSVETITDADFLGKQTCRMALQIVVHRQSKTRTPCPMTSVLQWRSVLLLVRRVSSAVAAVVGLGAISAVATPYLVVDADSGQVGRTVGNAARAGLCQQRISYVVWF
jgi:hypothetical protein